MTFETHCEMKQIVEFQDLGINRDYQEIWDYQESLLAENIAVKQYNRAQEKEGSSDFKNTKNHLLFVEHPHVYTHAWEKWTFRKYVSFE